MSTPSEHKTVQARILAYGQQIGWTYVPRSEAEKRCANSEDTILNSELGMVSLELPELEGLEAGSGTFTDQLYLTKVPGPDSPDSRFSMLARPVKPFSGYLTVRNPISWAVRDRGM